MNNELIKQYEENTKRQYNMSKTQYLRLQGYLYDLHISDEVCVFSELSGHVDWLDITVVSNRRDYKDQLFKETVYVATYYKPDQTDKEIVDGIIARIDEVVKSKVVRQVEAQKRREADERKQYEKLKAKYENTKEELTKLEAEL